MPRALSDREEQFAQAYILQGGGKVKAYEAAKYSMSMSKACISTQADKIFNRPNVNLRIKDLQSAVNTVIIKSKQDKLLILEKLMDKCSSDCSEKGVLNAAAVTAAIKEHNLMQGDNAPILTEGILKVDTTLAERLSGASKR